ncbi:MAG: CYTH domain-containing protein [Solirubrobacteraceae bacterium]
MLPALLDPRRNVELKARDDDPNRSLKACRKLGAEDHGTIQQRDTYFNVTSGGLKLREESPGSAHLIQFEREDEPQQRESRYRIVGIEDGPQLRAALQAALGVSVVIAKRRACTYGATPVFISTKSTDWARSSSWKPWQRLSLT